MSSSKGERRSLQQTLRAWLFLSVLAIVCVSLTSSVGSSDAILPWQDDHDGFWLCSRRNRETCAVARSRPVSKNTFQVARMLSLTTAKEQVRGRRRITFTPGSNLMDLRSGSWAATLHSGVHSRGKAACSTILISSFI